MVMIYSTTSAILYSHRKNSNITFDGITQNCYFQLFVLAIGKPCLKSFATFYIALSVAGVIKIVKNQLPIRHRSTFPCHFALLWVCQLYGDDPVVISSDHSLLLLSLCALRLCVEIFVWSWFCNSTD